MGYFDPPGYLASGYSVGRIRTEVGKSGMNQVGYFEADLQQQLSIALFARVQYSFPDFCVQQQLCIFFPVSLQTIPAWSPLRATVKPDKSSKANRGITRRMVSTSKGLIILQFQSSPLPEFLSHLKTHHGLPVPFMQAVLQRRARFSSGRPRESTPMCSTAKRDHEHLRTFPTPIPDLRQQVTGWP